MPPLPLTTVVMTPAAALTSQPAEAVANDLDALYREGVKARAHGHLDRVAAAWQMVLAQNPNYGLAPQLNEVLQKGRLLSNVGRAWTLAEVERSHHSVGRFIAIGHDWQVQNILGKMQKRGEFILRVIDIVLPRVR